MATEYYLQPGYNFANEFELGLGVILDALTRSIPDYHSENATNSWLASSPTHGQRSSLGCRRGRKGPAGQFAGGAIPARR